MNIFFCCVRSIIIIIICLVPVAHAANGDAPYAISSDTYCTQKENSVSQRGLYENFASEALNRCRWIAVHANWGGQAGGEDYNGGVAPDNILRRGNMLVLRAHGDRYAGPVRGIDSKGQARRDGRRTGAAIMTRQRFKGGRFEAKVKIAKQPGVVSAMWTHFYDWTSQGIVRNHEIAIEFPGQAAEMDASKPNSVRLAAWTGLRSGEHTATNRELPTVAADDKFHLLRFDWVPPRDSKTGVVKFYVDGVLQATTHSNVPSEPGNLWLGVWFPPLWAGMPDFAEAEMLVEWVRITPLGRETLADR